MIDCTVVMACWNQRGEWLKEAMRSALSEAKLILIDDGSANYEETVAAVDEVRATKAVNASHLIWGVHSGMEPALNTAIANVETPFVAILDSDDRMVSGSLALRLHYLRRHPEAVAVHGRFNYIDASGTVIRANQIHTSPCHSSLVFRRAAWERVGGYPEGFTYGEGDSGFIERLRGVGEVVALDIVCADRRVHPDSLSYPKQPRLQRILRESESK